MRNVNASAGAMELSIITRSRGDEVMLIGGRCCPEKSRWPNSKAGRSVERQIENCSPKKFQRGPRIRQPPQLDAALSLGLAEGNILRKYSKHIG